MHRIPDELLSRQVDVVVVGCGGTGSAVAQELVWLHQALIAYGHPGGLQVTFCDGATVSETNCVRQAFTQAEIGQYKATIIATRINHFFGLRWGAITQDLPVGHVMGAPGGDPAADIVIGCVDTAQARLRIHEAVTSAASRTCYWLDCGNGSTQGQILLGEPANGRTRKRPNRLPTAAEKWWDDGIIDPSKDVDLGPSCSAAESLTRQGPMVNRSIAVHAVNLLARLFRTGGLEWHGQFINLATGLDTPILVPAAVPPPSAARAAKPRRAAGRAGGGAG